MPWMLKVNEYDCMCERKKREKMLERSTFKKVISLIFHSGMTPLHKVAGNGYVDAAAVLLRYGANINNTTRSGNTALHLAARRGHENMVHISANVCFTSYILCLCCKLGLL